MPWYSSLGPAAGRALRGAGFLALRVSAHLTDAYCFSSFIRSRQLDLSRLSLLLLACLDLCLNAMVLAGLRGLRVGAPLAGMNQPLFLLCFWAFNGPWGARAVEFWEGSSLSVVIACVASILGSQAVLRVLETVYAEFGARAALPVAAAFCSKLAARYGARWACAVRSRASGDPQRRSTGPRKLLERMTPSAAVNAQLAHATVAYAVYFPVRALAGRQWAWRAGFAVDCANAALALVAFFGFGTRNPEDVYTALVEGVRELCARGAGEKGQKRERKNEGREETAAGLGVKPEVEPGVELRLGEESRQPAPRPLPQGAPHLPLQQPQWIPREPQSPALPPL